MSDRPVRLPDEQGVAVRDGVRLSWSSYGVGGPTLLLLPTWTIVSSRCWKAQVPYLAQHYRVVTFDGRGSGASDVPTGPAAYADAEYAADIVAVLDAAGVDRAVFVSWSCGASWAVQVASEHPDRVLGLFAISPACGFDLRQAEREEYAWDVRHDTESGWASYNRHRWLEGGYEHFLQFFFRTMFPEPHSTKQIEDGIAWGRAVDPATLVDATAGRLGLGGAVCTPLEPWCAQVRCPVVVVHGTDDQIRTDAIGRRLAELTRGTLLLMDGSGHGPHLRDPVRVNLEIRRFVDGLRGGTGVRRWTRASKRSRRALLICSPIGLGHARRDIAIAAELRARHPDLTVEWLAQHPVTRVLEEHAERVHPASAALLSESTHIELEAGEHDLHAFQAIRSMDEVMVNNAMVFADLVERESFDLIVADEAWEVDNLLHDQPELKRAPYAWLTDFVGWLPMPDGGPDEAALTADYNAEMIQRRARHRLLRDRSVFIGDPDDVVDDSFGPGLPGIRGWTADNFDFAGYVTGYEPPADRAELRARLGYAADDRVCLVTVGGSGVGEPLLRRVLDAVPAVRRDTDLRFVVVTGPRIDPASLPQVQGVEVRGYLPDLHEHLAACDVAVVQGGLTTCMELAAGRRPFVYVPLRHHFEQNLHVRHRLQRYHAGTCLPYDEAVDPDRLAAALLVELGRPSVDYLPVRSDGAARVADLLADLL